MTLTIISINGEYMLDFTSKNHIGMILINKGVVPKIIQQSEIFIRKVIPLEPPGGIKKPSPLISEVAEAKKNSALNRSVSVPPSCNYFLKDEKNAVLNIDTRKGNKKRRCLPFSVVDNAKRVATVTDTDFTAIDPSCTPAPPNVD